MGKVARTAWRTPCESCGSPIYTTETLDGEPWFLEACQTTGCGGGVFTDTGTIEAVALDSVPGSWLPLDLPGEPLRF